MKISVITVAYNSSKTLPDTIQSVLSQTYADIEYIVVDGGSKDGTVALLKDSEKRFKGNMKWISEPDRGIYDAMNKGIRMATGDVIGILNSDDYFTANDILSRVAGAFNNSNVDAVYGDIHFIKSSSPEKCFRYYSSAKFRPSLLRFGFMPAHPSFYVRRSIYEKAGLYKTDYKIGSDFEMMVRLFHTYGIKYKYLPIDFVTMRTGGASTRDLNSRWTLLKEDTHACRENGLYTNPLIISLKYFYKVTEFFRKGDVCLTPKLNSVLVGK